MALTDISIDYPNVDAKMNLTEQYLWSIATKRYLKMNILFEIPSQPAVTAGNEIK
ncbi:hypothetical protein C7475_1015 [Chitinophaga sp. S165]|nr:hypothetical protein C7475_1015 [Chitinophaga sp. S165]